MKLLIVDDDATNRKLLRAQLEAEGQAVVSARDGVDALRVLEQESVDAVISDILMPNMDGFRLCLEIRKHDKLSGLPFILYTSTYDSPEDRMLAESVGADRYITKPAPTPVLLTALDEAARLPRSPATAMRGPHDETYVLGQYNEALVRKLEEKNTELHRALLDLQAAHEDILEMNRSLESRVRQRTAELEAANRELEAANKELEAFSYSVSHDLRAPLRSIDGFTSIVLRDFASSLPVEAHRFLERVRESAGQMARLIDDLLTLARTGRQPLIKQAIPIPLQGFVNEWLDKFRDEIARRQVEVIVKELPDCYADPALLQQVFINLLDNALKYTRKQSHPVIEIGARNVDGEQAIYVQDNGVGFDMKQAKKLFGVFERLHRQTEFEGTGIGLAIVQRIVQRHHGRVWVEAEPGQGATFFFTLGTPET